MLNRSTRRPLLAAAAALAALTLTLTACGGAADAPGSTASGSGGTLTLYNAQHEDLVQELVDGFTRETGIEVRMRNGDDFEVANQIVQEGKASPADVFLTENSPAMDLVADHGLFARIPAGTAEKVPATRRPSSDDWIGFAARSTVLVYDKRRLAQDQLPASILDLADPAWKGQVGIAAAGADFQAIVSAVLSLKGEAATLDWLRGLKANAKVYPKNTAVMQAVNAGQIKAGVIYHYYWYKDQAEAGTNSDNTALHFFGHQDPGAFVSVSGAGVLASSRHKAEADRFVAYLVSPAGQKILADSTALEYPAATGAAANPVLKPLDELDPPAVDPSSLDGAKVVDLMQRAGLI